VGPSVPGSGGLDAQALLALDRAHVWHPYSSFPSPTPPYVVESAEGVRLRLAGGREVIDGMSSWWAAIHGYRHPVLDAAVTAQLSRMSHVMFGGLTHEGAVRLAQRLTQISPPGLDRVFLADSGSVSVEIAIKMCLQYWRGRGQPGKSRLLTVRGGYHGDTFGAMAVSDPETGMHHLFADVLPRHVFADRPPAGYDAPLEPAYVASLEQLVGEHAGRLAAVVVEPVVQGAGGMRFYAPGYLTVLRELCDRHDVLLLVDEIATGFGRSGTLFGCGHAEVSPDVMCVGKALTGGYLTMAATLCTAGVAEGISSGAGPLMHGPTFMGNALAAAVANASIDLLLAGDWSGRVRRIEALLAAGLADARGLDHVDDVRVLGAIGVVQLAHEVDVPAATAAALNQGVWLRPFRDLIYTMPPYVCSDEDVRTITRAVVAAAAGQSG